MLTLVYSLIFLKNSSLIGNTLTYYIKKMAASGITITIDSSLEIAKYRTPMKRCTTPTSTKDFVQSIDLTRKKSGKVLLATESRDNETRIPFLSHALLGTALQAYNHHHPLILSPDDIWISIMCALASHIDRNAESMRNLFVNHQGQIELTAYGFGNIHSADYSDLVNQLTVQIDNNTKDDIRDWVECSFTTTTDHSKIISKIILMGAMKNYFAYKMCILCGLPSITLEGCKDDWIAIRNRVSKMRTWPNQEILCQWADVLEYVLQYFIDAFDNKGIDPASKDFWNRIAFESGGGSGPRYICGWILAFCPFNDAGKYVLNPLDQIKKTNNFGKLNTNDVPACAVEVPVTIDDNGREYKTIFYAGSIMTQYNPETKALRPSQEWALIDVTNHDPNAVTNDFDDDY